MKPPKFSEGEWKVAARPPMRRDAVPRSVTGCAVVRNSIGGASVIRPSPNFGFVRGPHPGAKRVEFGLIQAGKPVFDR
jgi:hypothetical protein